MKSKYPRIIELWDHTWRKPRGGQVWLGPEITDPEDPTLAMCVQNQRIVRRHGRYVLEDPGITLNRFGWDEEAAEGMTWRRADGTRVDRDADEEDNP
jgi:hypothetical protein